MTVAVTLLALLELHKQDQASWTQDEPFGDITIRSATTPVDAKPTRDGDIQMVAAKGTVRFGVSTIPPNRRMRFGPVLD